jgi:hypothetical protein
LITAIDRGFWLRWKDADNWLQSPTVNRANIAHLQADRTKCAVAHCRFGNPFENDTNELDHAIAHYLPQDPTGQPYLGGNDEDDATSSAPADISSLPNLTRLHPAHVHAANAV